jgi:hypothetical protein
MTRASAASRERRNIINFFAHHDGIIEGRLSCGHVGLPVAFELVLGLRLGFVDFDLSPAARLALRVWHQNGESAAQKCEGKSEPGWQSLPPHLPASRQASYLAPPYWSRDSSKSTTPLFAIFNNFPPLCTSEPAEGGRGGVIVAASRFLLPIRKRAGRESSPSYLRAGAVDSD